MDGHGQKRKFPYHSDVPSFEVKQSRPESHPGREQNDPRVFQQPSYNYYDAVSRSGLNGKLPATKSGRSIQLGCLGAPAARKVAPWPVVSCTDTFLKGELDRPFMGWDMWAGCL